MGNIMGTVHLRFTIQYFRKRLKYLKPVVIVEAKPLQAFSKI